MAVLLAKASGNFTASTSWGVVDATSYLNAENATESLLTTAYSGTRSSAFTPGAITVDGIAVKLCERIGTTGTISVQLELDVGDVAVAGTEVTINVADLPSALESDLNGGWMFFKFATPVLLVAATAYQVAAKTSSATQVDLWCDGTGDNLARCLRTTTEAAPGAGDDMIITGEKTGAGAETTITVTMDCEATTDFGAAPSAANSLILPGLAITDGGVLTYGTTSAKNYYLKMSNSVIVYSGGILNIGTTGTPIPRDSTAILEFDPAADGDYGLLVRNLGTANIQGLSRTSGKAIFSCKLNTDEAINQTTLGVDTDTGWLDNDQIVVAPTTRTATETELGALNGNAGASSLTVDGFGGVGGGIAAAQSGTSPTQAEVINITRNVRIRSATSTIMSYVFCAATSTVDIDWAEFYYLGENATNKRGIEIATTTGSFNMQFSSIHDTEDGGIYIASSSGSTITFSNNVAYNLNTAIANGAPGAGLMVANATTGVITISGNVLLRLLASSTTANTNTGIYLADNGVTLTNNTIAGVSSNAVGNTICYNENNAAIGIHSGNTSHSNSNHGMCFGSSVSGGIPGGTMSTFTTWRNTGEGFFIGGSNITDFRVVFDSWVAFGNTTSNLNLGAAANQSCNFLIKSLTSNSDSTFATTNGIRTGTAPEFIRIYLLNCSFGSTTAHTQDVSSSGLKSEIIAQNTSFSAATETTAPASNNAVFRSNKHDQSSTTHKSVYQRGTIAGDQTIRHTASGYSWKMTPSSAAFPLILPGPYIMDTFKAVVNASALITIQAYVYKDATYNGNAPRLVLIGGVIGGIASDVTDSLTVAHSNWEQLEVTGTPDEAGVVEFYFDCDGTAGNAYVDDITITQA